MPNILMRASKLYRVLNLNFKTTSQVLVIVRENHQENLLKTKIIPGDLGLGLVNVDTLR